MTKQGEDLYHYNITNRITEKMLINCITAIVFLTTRFLRQIIKLSGYTKTGMIRTVILRAKEIVR